VVAPTIADLRRAADLHRAAARATGSASRWRVERCRRPRQTSCAACGAR
jgi:hypothetical protein